MVKFVSVVLGFAAPHFEPGYSVDGQRLQDTLQMKNIRGQMATAKAVKKNNCSQVLLNKQLLQKAAAKAAVKRLR